MKAIEKNAVAVSLDETIMYSDDSMYTGGVMKKVPKHVRHGYGSYYAANGDQYHGNFKDDNFDGEGTYCYANGDKYKGTWSNGVKEGEGELVTAEGAVFKMTYEQGIRVDHKYGQFLKGILSGKNCFFKGEFLAAGEAVATDFLGYKWVKIAPPKFIVLDGGPSAWRSWRMAMFDTWVWVAAKESTLKLTERDLLQSSEVRRLTPKKWVPEPNNPAFWVVFEEEYDPFARDGNRFMFLCPIINTALTLPPSKRLHILLPEELPETRDPVKKNSHSMLDKMQHTYLDHIHLDEAYQQQLATSARDVKIPTKNSFTPRLATSKDTPSVLSKNIFKAPRESSPRSVLLFFYLKCCEYNFFINKKFVYAKSPRREKPVEIKDVNNKIVATRKLLETFEHNLSTSKDSKHQQSLKKEIDLLRTELTKLEEQRESLVRSKPEEPAGMVLPKKAAKKKIVKKIVKKGSKSKTAKKSSLDASSPSSSAKTVSFTFGGESKSFDLDTAKFLLNLVKARNHSRAILVSQSGDPSNYVPEGIHSRGEEGGWTHKLVPGSIFAVLEREEEGEGGEEGNGKNSPSIHPIFTSFSKQRRPSKPSNIVPKQLERSSSSLSVPIPSNNPLPPNADPRKISIARTLNEAMVSTETKFSEKVPDKKISENKVGADISAKKSSLRKEREAPVVSLPPLSPPPFSLPPAVSLPPVVQDVQESEEEESESESSDDSKVSNFLKEDSIYSQPLPTPPSSQVPKSTLPSNPPSNLPSNPPSNLPPKLSLPPLSSQSGSRKGSLPPRVELPPISPPHKPSKVEQPPTVFPPKVDLPPINPSQVKRKPSLKVEPLPPLVVPPPLTPPPSSSSASSSLSPKKHERKKSSTKEQLASPNSAHERKKSSHRGERSHTDAPPLLSPTKKDEKSLERSKSSSKSVLPKEEVYKYERRGSAAPTSGMKTSSSAIEEKSHKRNKSSSKDDRLRELSNMSGSASVGIPNLRDLRTSVGIIGAKLPPTEKKKEWKRSSKQEEEASRPNVPLPKPPKEEEEYIVHSPFHLPLPSPPKREKSPNSSPRKKAVGKKEEEEEEEFSLSTFSSSKESTKSPKKKMVKKKKKSSVKAPGKVGSGRGKAEEEFDEYDESSEENHSKSAKAVKGVGVGSPYLSEVNSQGSKSSIKKSSNKKVTSKKLSKKSQELGKSDD